MNRMCEKGQGEGGGGVVKYHRSLSLYVALVSILFCKVEQSVFHTVVL